MTKGFGRVEIVGDIRADMRDDVDIAARAVSGAMRVVAEGLQNTLRRQVVTAGLGQRLAQTWKGEAFPKTGASLGAAAAIWSRAPKIIRAHTEGALIRSSRGVWLAIPTENAPKMSSFRRVTPSNFPELTLGKLRFVAVPGRKLGLLVVDKVRRHTGKRRGFEKATSRAVERGTAEDSVVMFYLVPQAQLRKKLDLDGPAEDWSNKLPRLLGEQFAKLDGEAA